jgi:hypothetical protein
MVRYYRTAHNHEALVNLPPADVYFGRTDEVLLQQELTKQRTLQDRRRVNLHRGIHVLAVSQVSSVLAFSCPRELDDVHSGQGPLASHVRVRG